MYSDRKQPPAMWTYAFVLAIGKDRVILRTISGQSRLEVTSNDIKEDLPGLQRSPTVCGLSSEVIEATLSRSLADAMPMDMPHRYSFAATEGRGGGKMDYAYARFNSATCDFYVYDGMIYNQKDFGNYLWGAAMTRLGFSGVGIKCGSEANAFFHGKAQNGGHGICWSGDSKEDQAAIARGATSVFAHRACPSCGVPERSFGTEVSDDGKMLWYSVKNVFHIFFGSGSSAYQKLDSR